MMVQWKQLELKGGWWCFGGSFFVNSRDEWTPFNKLHIFEDTWHFDVLGVLLPPSVLTWSHLLCECVLFLLMGGHTWAWSSFQHLSGFGMAQKLIIIVPHCSKYESTSFYHDCFMLSAAALTVTSKMKKGHFYYAKWTLNSNCILTVISIMKQEKIAPGFSEISAQNHFYFATRQFLRETKSQKFQNRHINVQNGHIKMKLTVQHLRM